jgi:Ca2+-binding RTX toxin-like protein
MGSSGNSTAAHLHFEVQYKDHIVATNLDRDTFYEDAFAYSGDSPGTRYSGTSSTAPTTSERKEGLPQMDEFAANQSVTFWNYNNRQNPGDLRRYTWFQPDGTVFVQANFTQTNFARSAFNRHTITLPADPLLGLWEVRLEQNFVETSRANFTVSATGAPEIRVEEGESYIIDDRFSPLDFGPVAQNATAPTRSFMVKNNGSATLTLGAVTLPTGYTVTDALPAALAPGATDTLTISLGTATAGYFAGQVRIANNDPNESEFNFSVEGVVTSGTLENLTIGISQRIPSEGQQIVANVSRSGDTSGDEIVTLTSSDTSEVTVPAAVVIPAGEDRVSFFITIEDDGIVDGPQSVVLTATATGFADASNTVDVINVPTLTLDFAVPSISESDGVQATTATVTRAGTDNSASLGVTLTNGDASEISIPTTVTIPAGLGSVSFDIDAIDDSILDGTQRVAVSASANGFVTGSDTIRVDDFEQLVVSISAASISENGGLTTATVSRTDPNGNLTVNLLSSDTTEATTVASVVISDGNLTSSPFIITAVDDMLLDGSQTVTIDAMADGHVTGSDSLEVTDFEPLTVTIAANSISEAGGLTSATVSRIQSVGNVTVSLMSDDTTEATVLASVLIADGQTTSAAFPIGAANDALVDGTQTVTITASATGYADGSDTISVTDEEIPSFTIVESSGNTVVGEAAGTDTFTVVLDFEPIGDVVLSVTPDDLNESSVDKTSLTFTTLDWNQPQTVTVIGVNDTLAIGDGVTSVTVAVNDLASQDAYDPAIDQTVSVSTTDDDIGFTVTESDGSTVVSETGTTDTFTVVLNGQPLSSVVINVVSGDTDEATVDKPALMFSPMNWNQPQVVTVTGVNDPIIDGNQFTTTTLTVNDAISDNLFDGLPDQMVSVETIDDNIPGFTIVESAGTTEVNESGTTDSFTVVLDTAPFTDVVVLLGSGNLAEAVIDTSMLTFTNMNWDQPRTVIVTGVDDQFVDADQNTSISVAVDVVNSDVNFAGVAAQTVVVTTVDDETLDVLVTESGGNTVVSESGTSDTFEVVLPDMPLSTVVLMLTSADPGEVTVDTSSLTFTTTDWNMPRTVTVTGVDDILADGDIATLVSISVDAANSDDVFDSLPDKTVTVSTTDDDVADFTITETMANTIVSEAGSTDTFSVILTAKPISPVVLTVASNDTTEATVDKATLTFQPDFWNVAQTVTVTGVDDNNVDGAQSTPIAVNVDAANSADAFDALPQKTVTVSTTDDDVADLMVQETNGSTTVSESGTQDTVQISLTAQPILDVVLNLQLSDASEATSDTTSLTFTNANWNIPRTVTITGVDDPAADGDQTTTLSISVDADNSDDVFDLVTRDVAVITTEDDTAGFVVTQTDGTTIVAESGTSDSLSIVLTAQPLTPVSLTVTSLDTDEAVATTSTVMFSSMDWDMPHIVQIIGVDDDVDDGDITATIVISVDAVSSNDAFDGVADQTVDITVTDDDTNGIVITETMGSTSVDESGTSDTFAVTLAAQPLSPVTVNVLSGDLGEATVDVANLTFDSMDWNMPKNVTVTGADDPALDGDRTTSITVSVDPANSDDAYDAAADATVTVTTTDDDVAGFLTSISGLDTQVSETGTSDTFDIVLTAQPTSQVVIALAPADPGEISIGQFSVSFTTASWNTPQTVTVTGVDDGVVDGDQSSAILLRIVDVFSNDGFDSLPDQSIAATTLDDEVAGIVIAQTNGTTVVSEDGTTDSFALTLAARPLSDVVVNVASLDTNAANIDTPTLTFTPSNWNTPQLVVVTAVDDQTVNGTRTSSISIAVNAANSDDLFDSASDQTLTVTINDDEIAGFSITESDGDTVVDETGSTDTFDVVLTAQPLGNVVLDIGNPDTGEISLDKTTLTFDSINWSSPQTVTVTGVNDAITDSIQSTTITISVDLALSDDPFDSASTATIVATTIDNELIEVDLPDGGGDYEVLLDGDDIVVRETLGAEILRQPRSDTQEVQLNGTDADETITVLNLGVGFDIPLSIAALGGNDTIDARLAEASVSISGGAGDDVIDGGQANDLIDGGLGLDIIRGNEGDDDLNGAEGNDVLTGGLGNDLIDGGAGIDKILETADADLTLTNALLIGNGIDLLTRIESASLIGGPSPNTIDASGFIGVGFTFLDGGGGGDTIFGTAGNDIITSSGNGDDEFHGGAGRDFFFAGSGNDLLFGEAGDDVLFGQGGSDVIDGGDGDDALEGGGGNDVLNGQAGTDKLFGGTGNDVLNGGSSRDSLHGGEGDDILRGGQGNDFLIGGSGIDDIDGQGNNDRVSHQFNGDITVVGLDVLSDAGSESLGLAEIIFITGDSSDNVIDLSAASLPAFINAGDGNDVVIGSEFDDVILGGAGNDVLIGGGGDDSLDGGLGFDIAQATRDADFTISGNTLNGHGLDTLAGFEQIEVFGGPSNNVLDASASLVPVVLDGAGGEDRLIGSPFADVIFGGAGDDVITGGLGDDQIDGGAGNSDKIQEVGDFDMTLTNSTFVGPGNNTLVSIELASLTGGPSPNVIDASGFVATGLTFIDGAGGGDVLIGTAGPDILTSTGNGNDSMLAGDGDDFVFGGSGSDTIRGGAGDDVLFGNGGGDRLFGEDGNDRLDGGTGSDPELDGESGNDLIFGGNGNDVIRGGPGKDSLSGGIGVDQLFGQQGGDLLSGGHGDDFIDGGGAIDRFSETSDSDFTVVGQTVHSVATGTETLVGIEIIFLIGGASNNRLDASQSTLPVVLIGLGGDDILGGGLANDTIDGGSGNDIINGGLGDDLLVGGEGNDGISGFQGNDELSGGAGNDLLVGHDGADNINGEGGEDTLVGGGGTSVAGDGIDALVGGPDADQLDGDPGEFTAEIGDTIAAFTAFPSWVDAI